MGTNYYWFKEDKCKCCKREYPAIHIGKSSAGWVFALHVYPEEGLHNLEDWKLRWATKDSYIEDEYGRVIDIEMMLEIITNRIWKGDLLRRNPMDNDFCVGRGKGTWDYCIGEFS